MPAALRTFLNHFLRVAAFCTVISLLLWLLRPDRLLHVQMAYSFGIGMTSWLLIEGGAWLLAHQQPGGWPEGWHGVALIGVGVLGGFVIGTGLGDWVAGRSTFDHRVLGSEWFGYMAMFSLAAGVGISYYFYATAKSRFLLAELQASRRQAAEARLKLLEAQLEPHMLFNTLANLRALIGTDPAAAQAMLDRLNGYLRATLGASRATLHPLATEFERLQDYLALMQVRMGPRLRYTLALPEALRDQPVPPLLLQPLVENAIRHGLEPQVGGGSITVRAERVAAAAGNTASDTLRLTVADTGVGLNATSLNDMDLNDTSLNHMGLNDAARAALAAPAAPPGPPHHVPDALAARHTPPHAPAPTPHAPGFGLQQVRERLHTLHGAAARMVCEGAPGQGTRITLQWPLAPGEPAPGLGLGPQANANANG